VLLWDYRRACVPTRIVVELLAEPDTAQRLQEFYDAHGGDVYANYAGMNLRVEPAEVCPGVNYLQSFGDPQLAMLFKLTFGGNVDGG
jgi:hypothetical protein